MLRHPRIDYEWLLFEELFQGETTIEDQAREIAEWLGVTIQPDDSRLDAFGEKRNQNSAAIMEFIPNLTELEATVEELCSA